MTAALLAVVRTVVLTAAALAGVTAIAVGVSRQDGSSTPRESGDVPPAEPEVLTRLRGRQSCDALGNLASLGYVTVRLFDRDGDPWAPAPFERRSGATEPVLETLEGGPRLVAYLAEPRSSLQDGDGASHVARPASPVVRQTVTVMEDGTCAVSVPSLMPPHMVRDVLVMSVGGDAEHGWFHGSPVHLRYAGLGVSWPPVEIRAQAEPPVLVPLEVEITGDTAFGDDPEESVVVEWADTKVPLLTASPKDARCAFEVPPGHYRVRALRDREAWGQIPIERGALEVTLAPGAPVRITLDVAPDAR